MKEIWKDVEGYEGLYSVSNYGRVLGIKRNKILKPESNGLGYQYVNLSRNGFVTHVSVHRLVAKAFVPNPSNLPEVNHKDEDKTNNFSSNLEWTNRSDNTNYGTRNKRSIETNIQRGTYKTIASKYGVAVLQFSLDNKLIKRWSNMHEIERTLGYIRANIRMCCNGKYNQAYGYLWKYEQFN